MEFCVISLEIDTEDKESHHKGRGGRSDITKEGKYQKIPVKILKQTESSQSFMLLFGHYLADLQL